MKIFKKEQDIAAPSGALLSIFGVNFRFPVSCLDAGNRHLLISYSMKETIEDIAASTPAPERSLNNLRSFIKENPEVFESFSKEDIGHAALLFSYSQFLAAFCIKRPEVLSEMLGKIDLNINRSMIESELLNTKSFLNNSLANASDGKKEPFIYDLLRETKKRILILITLRYILNKSELIESMNELSLLADVLIGEAYRAARKELTESYGAPDEDSFAVIALGKLGGGELNFSSDVDFICVYGNYRCDTNGILGPQGVRRNIISNHEFYCKLVEKISRILSLNTHNGFVYRVDLRLRPEGQKGELALSLGNYELYYESWGREWERVALIRARHIAGDDLLTAEFINTVRPFVYRKYIDMGSIDEIRRLKTKIDAAFKESDIKRGRGGIREIEFFTQTLQIIYGGRERLLIERRLLIALHRLRMKNLIGDGDYNNLYNNYLYLRRLEHVIQMLNDIQTHKLPSNPNDLAVLAGKMGFVDVHAFNRDLQERRTQVHTVFNSLFRPADKNDDDNGIEESILFYKDITDEELTGILRERTGMDGDKVSRLSYYIKKIRDSMNEFQTLRGKRVKDRILPYFVESAIKSEDPVKALKNLIGFVEMLRTNETYLDIFQSQKGLIELLAGVFCVSEHLSSIIISNPRYVHMLSEGTPYKKTLRIMENELWGSLKKKSAPGEALSIFRKMEEIRLGIMYLNGKISLLHITKGLSRAAEAVLTCTLNSFSTSGNILIIGFGKLGGREITINSDLDITFVSGLPPDYNDSKDTERVLRSLMSYTKEGIAYKVDTRLRPEGSKGPLVTGLDALRKYYLNSAHFWEIQALLKSRPVAGNVGLRRKYCKFVKEIVTERGMDVAAGDIIQMRERIKRELFNNSAAFDVKLAPGGIEDIEFLVQYLQLKHASLFPRLIVQNTLVALRRLIFFNFIDMENGNFLAESYVFLRKTETYVRLMGESCVPEKENIIESLSKFTNLNSPKVFKAHLSSLMENTKHIVDKLMI